MRIQGSAWCPNRKPTGRSLFSPHGPGGTNKREARGLVAGGSPPVKIPGAFAPLFLMFLLLCPALPGHAEVGTGQSTLFNVDTRWGFGTGAGVSELFQVNTRFSGSSGESYSGLFTVDTLGAAVGDASFAGYVMDANGVGLGGATVAALQFNVVRGQAGTDANGFYQITSLPGGTYEIRASKAGYLAGLRYGVVLAPNHVDPEHFRLSSKPVVPETKTVVRPQESAQLPTVIGDQLKVFVKDSFVVHGPFDPAKPTVIMTHGWNSSPAIWPLRVAASMVAGGADANILAWDWNGDAATGLKLSKALSAVPRQGPRLGQTLAANFGPMYGQGVHFIGHSLGTLVNAAAANYLHEETAGRFDWLRDKTQFTLLDDAVLANVEGTAVQLGWWKVGVEAPYEVGSVFGCGWLSPIPRHRGWMDNYISLVGLPHPEAVNVWLTKSFDYGQGANLKEFVESVHGYAPLWYGDTAARPQAAALGNRYSYEQLGRDAQFPSPSPYPLGSFYMQAPQSTDPLALAAVPIRPDSTEMTTLMAANLGRFGLGKAVDAAVGVAEKVGSVVVDVVNSFFPHTPSGTPVYSGTAGSTVAYYGQNGVVDSSMWSIQVNLNTGQARFPFRTGPRPLGGGDAGTNEAPCIWIPVSIPTNAALFCFDFTLDGTPEEDMLTANIGGTNVFALEARFMPKNTALNSGPIDVTPWAGKTVELFFGLIGGTSTNASIVVNGMRFYNLQGPSLRIEIAGNDILVWWPAGAQGYTLQSTPELSASSQWSTVTNTPGLIGLQNVVTNSISTGSRFYRLSK